MSNDAVEAIRKPQLVHTARQMFETRLAKYNDPHNLEWDMDDMTDKWERHAFSAFMDLQATEAERDQLQAEVDALRGENGKWREWAIHEFETELSDTDEQMRAALMERDKTLRGDYGYLRKLKEQEVSRLSSEVERLKKNQS